MDDPWEFVHDLVVFNGDLIVGGDFVTASGQIVNHIARWDGEMWHPLESGGQIGVGDASSTVRALAVYNGDLIVGGRFTTAGGQTVNGIARWDGEQWYPFESNGHIGLDGPSPHLVLALNVHNGDLIVGGTFTSAGGQTANRIARWDGMKWHPFSSGGQNGMNDKIFDLVAYNGDLIASGSFSTAGGQTINGIARWDGLEWHAFTSGGQIGLIDSVSTVGALFVYNGDLIAGGSFTTAGGILVNHIARWDGVQWRPFPGDDHAGVKFGGVSDMTLYNGNLVVAGSFLSAGGTLAYRVAQWDGCAWSVFESQGEVGVGGTVVALAVFNEDLIVGGYFGTAGVHEANSIAAWNGCSFDVPCASDLNGDGLVDGADLSQLLANWGACSDCNDCPWDLTGDCVADGSDLAQLLANWDECAEPPPPPTGACCFGMTCEELTMTECCSYGGTFVGNGTVCDDVLCELYCEPYSDNTIGQPGMDEKVQALTFYNGDPIAGGSFSTANGQEANWIARWDGSQWLPFVAGPTAAGDFGLDGPVRALTVYKGDLIAGGEFTAASGQTVNHIARWDGEVWHPLVSGGQIGVGGPGAYVRALTVHNGDLVVGGSFPTAGGQEVRNVARWDGTAWHPYVSNGQPGVGGTDPQVNALTVYKGDLIAGGAFTVAGTLTVNRIARWDGVEWHQFESGGQVGVDGGWVTPRVIALTVHNGDLFAGGNFGSAGGQAVGNISRWDGTEWHQLESNGHVGFTNPVRALAVFDGELILGGSFASAGGQLVNRMYVGAKGIGNLWTQGARLEWVERSPWAPRTTSEHSQ